MPGRPKSPTSCHFRLLAARFPYDPTPSSQEPARPNPGTISYHSKFEDAYPQRTQHAQEICRHRQIAPILQVLRLQFRHLPKHFPAVNMIAKNKIT